MGVTRRQVGTARSTVYPKVADFCGFCGQGHHHLCPGAIDSRNGRPAWTCACADSGHRPGDDLAGVMRLYQRGDLHGDTVEHLAEEYRSRSSLAG